MFLFKQSIITSEFLVIAGSPSMSYKRISGPFVSHITAIGKLSFFAASRQKFTRINCSSTEPCEKFNLMQFAPALITAAAISLAFAIFAELAGAFKEA
jgi:hypothetical protein